MLENDISFEDLKKKMSKYAPVEIDLKQQLSDLSKNDKEALKKILKASALLNPLFRLQRYRDNEKIRNVKFCYFFFSHNFLF